MSKGLEALESVRTRQVVMPIENNIFGEYIIKGQELITIEQELKALEIIKKKCSPLLKQYLLDLLPKEESKLVEEVLCEKEQKI